MDGKHAQSDSVTGQRDKLEVLKEKLNKMDREAKRQAATSDFELAKYANMVAVLEIEKNQLSIRLAHLEEDKMMAAARIEDLIHEVDDAKSMVKKYRKEAKYAKRELQTFRRESTGILTAEVIEASMDMVKAEWGKKEEEYEMAIQAAREALEKKDGDLSKVVRRSTAKEARLEATITSSRAQLEAEKEAWGKEREEMQWKIGQLLEAEAARRRRKEVRSVAFAEGPTTIGPGTRELQEEVEELRRTLQTESIKFRMERESWIVKGAGGGGASAVGGSGSEREEGGLGRRVKGTPLRSTAMAAREKARVMTDPSSASGSDEDEGKDEDGPIEGDVEGAVKRRRVEVDDDEDDLEEDEEEDDDFTPSGGMDDEDFDMEEEESEKVRGGKGRRPPAKDAPSVTSIGDLDENSDQEASPPTARVLTGKARARGKVMKKAKASSTTPMSASGTSGPSVSGASGMGRVKRRLNIQRPRIALAGVEEDPDKPLRKKAIRIGFSIPPMQAQPLEEEVDMD